MKGCKEEDGGKVQKGVKGGERCGKVGRGCKRAEKIKEHGKIYTL